jgi:hypothetical protein
MSIRPLLSLLVALPILLSGTRADAKHKPRAPKAPKTAKVRGEKPERPDKHAAHDGSALFEAMAQANRASEMLEQMIIDVQAAGDDSSKIKEIAENYQTLSAAMKGEAAEREAALTKPEKRHLDSYRRSKLVPLEHKWEKILAKVEGAVAQEVESQLKQFHNQIEDLLAETDAIIAQTRSAGADSARRSDLLQRIARLQASTHSLYHDAAKVPGRKNAEELTREITEKLETQVRRADWLLRTAVLPPCPDFTKQLQQVHKQIQELDGLSADISLAVNRAGLNEQMAKRARLMAQIAATVRAPLTPEEAAELRAVTDELLVPVQAHLDEAQATAEERVGSKRRGER